MKPRLHIRWSTFNNVLEHGTYFWFAQDCRREVKLGPVGLLPVADALSIAIEIWIGRYRL